MRLHDGIQQCPKCQGQGCYWCRKSGEMAQCPVCMNHEPELLTRIDKDVKCHACDALFDRQGALLSYPGRPAKKPTGTPKTA